MDEISGHLLTVIGSHSPALCDYPGRASRAPRPKNGLLLSLDSCPIAGGLEKDLLPAIREHVSLSLGFLKAQTGKSNGSGVSREGASEHSRRGLIVFIKTCVKGNRRAEG